jgi:phosphopantothenoylcysteine decarboxylase
MDAHDRPPPNRPSKLESGFDWASQATPQSIGHSRRDSLSRGTVLRDVDARVVNAKSQATALTEATSETPSRVASGFIRSSAELQCEPTGRAEVDELRNREILVGVTGGIAAYKTADLVSKLVQSGASVTVAMTEAATQFIGPTTFEALTNRPVYCGMFSPVEHPQGEHIGLARRAALYVVAPATADFVAKAAHGLASDLVSTLALTVTCPILLAPAMNTEMWNKPPVQRNLQQVAADGMQIIQPGSGWLSCGQVGPGRMAEPADILEAIRERLA